MSKRVLNGYSLIEYRGNGTLRSALSLAAADPLLDDVFVENIFTYSDEEYGFAVYIIAEKVENNE